MRHWVWALAVLVAVTSNSTFAIPGGQKDDFESGTAQGWGNGQGTPAANLPTGGPAGTGDNYLEVNDLGIRLVVLNTTQWAGDYSSLTSIAMDLKNTSGGARPMRLGLRSSFGSSITPGYVSTNAFNLPSDGLWHHVVFNLDASSLTPINSPAPLAAFLSSVGEMRILSASTASLLGDTVTGPIGIDNITAQPVPEPSALAFLAAAAVAAPRRRAR